MSNFKTMVEVFITNIYEPAQASKTLETLKAEFPELSIHFDLHDPKEPFPCGHSVLRTEGADINSKEIIAAVARSGFLCDVLEDKACK